MPDAVWEAADQVCCTHSFTMVGDAVGEGAFKRTYRVRCSPTEERALKIYKDTPNPERLTREIEAIRRCKHAAVVRLHSGGIVEARGVKHLFTLEEYLPGGSLSARAQARLLAREETLAVTRTLAGALGHLDSLDLVHRDIKPGNIMFRDGLHAPVLVDFGLVRDLSKGSVTATWAVPGPGTPLFAAPEQLLNDKELIDWRCDQFGLAVTMVVASTGQHPFGAPGEPVTDVIERVASRGPLAAWFKEWAKNSDLLALVRMLGVWPIERYPTPDALLAELV